MKGRASFELARRAAFIAFKVEQLFREARSPFTRGEEAHERERRVDETPEEAQVLNEWYSRSKRLNPLGDSLREFQEIVWEAPMVFDDAMADTLSRGLDTYRTQWGELASAVTASFQLQHQIAKGQGPRNQDDFLQNMNLIIYERPDDNLAATVKQTTADVTTQLKRYVRKGS
ncbi:MAG: hypothetical protein O2884_12460 [Chloroflexi bacterium]|nr:hypothetical protein [Chloroflexota bacterium]